MMDVIGRVGLALVLAMVTAAVGAGGEAVTKDGDGRIAVAGAARGELLYENHCTVCHQSTVHIRANRKAKSITDIRGWAARWAGELKLNWTSDDIDDVAEFLAKRYYKCSDKTEKC